VPEDAQEVGDGEDDDDQLKNSVELHDQEGFLNWIVESQVVDLHVMLQLFIIVRVDDVFAFIHIK